MRPAILAALSACLVLPVVPVCAQEAPERVFVGYLFGSPRDVEFGLYTHVCHAFLTADADGRLRPSRGVPSREVADSAHTAGAKVLLSLGGWGWDDQFAAMVKVPESEDRYVEAVLTAVDEADYDGIDLDWEYPDTKEEVLGFERLTRRLRSGLDQIGQRKGRPMLLTMAASSNPGTLRWLDRDFLMETMDWINVMTYDMAGPWTRYAGHNAPLFASSSAPGRSTADTMRFLVEERKLPPDRLAVGIPLYGRGFAVSQPYASTVNIDESVQVPRGDYRNLHALLNEKGWTRHFDDETKTPWLTAPDQSIVIGYDDDESVAIKTEWALEQGFRGVFFWQIASDRLPDGRRPLQEASRAVFDRVKPVDSPR